MILPIDREYVTVSLAANGFVIHSKSPTWSYKLPIENIYSFPEKKTSII